MIAPHTSIIYQKYVRPILTNSELPYFVLHTDIPWHNEILSNLSAIFALLYQYGLKSPFGSFPDIHLNSELLKEACFEMKVQCSLNQIWQSIYNHVDQLPKITHTQKDVQYQVRLQKMLSFIHQNCMNEVSLQDISVSACYTTHSIQEICLECGINSASYFIKVFKKKVGMTPREYRINLADSSCSECRSDENA